MPEDLKKWSTLKDRELMPVHQLSWDPAFSQQPSAQKNNFKCYSTGRHSLSLHTNHAGLRQPWHAMLADDTYIIAQPAMEGASQNASDAPLH